MCVQHVLFCYFLLQYSAVLVYSISDNRSVTMDAEPPTGAESYPVAAGVGQRRWNANKRTLVVTTVDYKPFSIKFANGTWGGICFDVLNELASMYQFSYTVMEPPDGAWGVDLGNGTYNGMIGLVQKGADIGVNPFTITDGRHRVVDFTVPMFYDNYILVMRKPAATNSVYFTKPFSTEVWFAIAAAVPAVSLFTSVYLVVSIKIRETDARRRREKQLISWYFGFFWLHLKAALNQSLQTTPKPTAVRVVLALWWMLCLMLAAVYMGNLTAALTARKIKLPITDIKSLTASPFTVTVEANSAPIDFMRTSQNKALRDLYRQKIEPRLDKMPRSLVKQFEEALLDSKSIAMVPYKVFRYMQYLPPPFNKLKCEFSVAKINMFWNLGAFPVRRDSVYGRELSKGLLRLSEVGVIERVTRQYTGPSGCTGYERTEQLSRFNFSSVFGVVLLLAYGVALSTAVIVMELFVYKTRFRLKSVAAIFKRWR